MHADDAAPPARHGSALTRVLPWVAALAVVAAIGVAVVFRFVADERERDLRAWQARLGIVADSRLAAVDGWVEDQFAELRGLAENASLQIYMSAVEMAGSDPQRVAEAEPQAGYLRTLLAFTAERAGFAGLAGASDLDASAAPAGIALVDMHGRTIAATPAMPPLDGALGSFLAGLPRGQRGVLDLFLDRTGQPAMGFAVPVFAVQGEGDAAAQIGRVVGVKEVARELYPLLKQPGGVEETAEAVLVRAVGGVIEYLSPLAGGNPPLGLERARDTPDLDAAFALEKPGGFAVRRDYRNREVLATGRAVAGVPWALVYKVDRAEALGDSDARLVRLLAFLLLAIALGAVLILAFWRHGSSLRAEAAARRNRELAQRYAQQRDLLGLVTDSQPTAIFILDEEGRYRFANRPAAEMAGLPAEAMIGKPASHVLGPEAARRCLDLDRRALETGRAVADTARSELDGKVRIVHSRHIPLAASLDLPRGVLVVEHDISEAVLERERRARILSQLVRALVGVVDRRDPFAADHSVRVAMLARAMATEMGLGAVEVETAETAGNLMNLGKILVSTQLLTRAGRLNAVERQQIRLGMQTSAELLAGIEFDGPVVETLRQAQARWDGADAPGGPSGEGILATARIIAVANAFVGMTSRRAHREALDIDRAIESLLAEAGRAFDRRVVAALVEYLDNRGGRVRLMELDLRRAAS